MFDFDTATQIWEAETGPRAGTHHASTGFWVGKRAFDIGMCLLLLPVVLLVAAALIVLNPAFNRGPLIFSQIRMGKGCRPFNAYKFRSMRAAPKIERGADDPLERDRIPPMGDFLRRSRLDELPQVFNVLRGDMSLIGPRPDYFAHAEVYLREIPEYRARHSVRPGISGLAQVELGYVEGIRGTRAKAQVDLDYIRNAGWRQEIVLIFRTLCTVLGRDGL